MAPTKEAKREYDASRREINAAKKRAKRAAARQRLLLVYNVFDVTIPPVAPPEMPDLGYTTIMHNDWRVNKPRVSKRYQKKGLCDCKNGHSNKCKQHLCDNMDMVVGSGVTQLVTQLECNATNCSFGSENCGNRWLTQTHHLTSCVHSGQMSGRGLTALATIPADAVIGQHVGRVTKLNPKAKKSGYGMALQCNDEKFLIDAEHSGNLTRFINHGCDPNCEFVQRRVDGEEQVWVGTLREIEKGEELKCDYGGEATRFFKNGVYLCGASNCKSTDDN